MLVRFFEYDTQIALDEGEIKKDVLTMKVFDFHSMDGHAARPTAG
jgi:hypothetical protein